MSNTNVPPSGPNPAGNNPNAGGNPRPTAPATPAAAPAPREIKVDNFELGDMKKFLGDRNAEPFEIKGEYKKLFDRRMKRYAGRADKLGAFNEEGDFRSTKLGGSDVSRRVERLEDLAEKVKKYEAGGPAHKVFSKLEETEKKALKKQAGGLFRQLNDFETHHANHIAAASEYEAEYLGKLEKHYATEYEKLETEHAKAVKALGKPGPGEQDAALYEKKLAELCERHDELTKGLEARRDAIVSSVEDHFKDVRKLSEDQIKNAKELTASLEKHTGLNAAEHLAPKAVLSAEKGAAKAVEQAAEKEAGVFARMGQNLKGGFGAKAKVAIGVMAGGGLAVSGFKDIAGRTDEQGKPVETSTFVGLLKLVGGLVGGAMLAGHR